MRQREASSRWSLLQRVSAVARFLGREALFRLRSVESNTSPVWGSRQMATEFLTPIPPRTILLKSHPVQRPTRDVSRALPQAREHFPLSPWTFRDSWDLSCRHITLGAEATR